jgi:hypothetical protein
MADGIRGTGSEAVISRPGTRTRSLQLHLWLTRSEYQRLRDFAAQNDETMAQTVRRWIRILPLAPRLEAGGGAGPLCGRRAEGLGARSIEKAAGQLRIANGSWLNCYRQPVRV